MDMVQHKESLQLQFCLGAVENLSSISCSSHIVWEKGGKVLSCFSGIYSSLLLGLLFPQGSALSRGCPGIWRGRKRG